MIRMPWAKARVLRTLALIADEPDWADPKTDPGPVWNSHYPPDLDAPAVGDPHPHDKYRA